MHLGKLTKRVALAAISFESELRRCHISCSRTLLKPSDLNPLCRDDRELIYWIAFLDNKELVILKVSKIKAANVHV